MKPPRAALLVAATALAPALLLTTPAFATGAQTTATTTSATVTAVSETPADVDDDRVAVFRILYLAQQNGDKAVIREANKALDDGTPEALRAFLETGYRIAQAEDDGVATARILYLAQQNKDKAVIREANKALDDGSPEALRAFRVTGYPIAQEEDDRVATARILYLAQQRGDKAVIREANKALDGTAADVRTFRTTGYRLAQAEDDRVAIARILADPTISDALRAAASAAIDGTPEELRYFLEVGQYEVDR
ncbi:ALF repeat-containing protein [Streptomyces sp. NPDC091292]|uniref:ALF repeat-containing protein n=1 Tax=Streptomyces sp. NPDC091292 TaxID=3365991 RepID=UPI003828F401